MGGRDTGDEMARARTQAIDSARISQLADELRLAVTDKEIFNSVCDAIADDNTISAAEVIDIAHKFLGGSKPKSRKAALSAIRQERLRLSHAKAKGETASKAKTW